MLQLIEPPCDSPVLTNKMVKVMPTRRPTFFILACLLLATGLNTGWSDSRWREAARETEGTTATRAISSAQEKRAALMARGKQSFIKLVGEDFVEPLDVGQVRVPPHGRPRTGEAES